MANPTFFERDDVRDLSRLVFGQDHKLAVLLVFVRADGPMTIGDVTSAVGARNTSSLQRPMQDLLRVGFISESASSVATDRARRYEKSDSAVWALAEELYAKVDERDALPFG